MSDAFNKKEAPHVASAGRKEIPIQIEPDASSGASARQEAATEQGYDIRPVAKQLIEEGFAVVKVKPNDKGTSEKNWPELRVTAEQVAAWDPECNVGVVWGPPSNDLVEFDLESKEAARAANALPIETGMVFGRASNPTGHRVYRCAGAKTKKFVSPKGSEVGDKAMLLELRAAGTYTVAPGSRHPSGELYEWSTKDAPAEVSIEDLTVAATLISLAITIGRYWDKGARHDASLALAGWLRRRGYSFSRCWHLLQAIAGVAGDEQMKDRVDTIKSTFEKDIDAETTGLPTLIKILDPPNIKDFIPRLESWVQDSADQQPVQDLKLDDFHAYLPMHHYIYVPTKELWPSSSVDGSVAWPVGVDGKPIKPSHWLDANRPIEQMTWQPGQPQIIKDMVIQISGWIPHAGARVFNLYRPPDSPVGDAARAQPWLDHVRLVYPDDADHLISWFAHRVQRPGEKLNHGIVLMGAPGIGKDTILHPVKVAVGAWNWQEINPSQMLGRFCGWAKSVICRVSEARDLGDVDRFSFYEHSKVYLASPPDVLRIDEKFIREHYIPNLVAMVITSNHSSDGIYLPADDRRHFVASSALTKDDFKDGYWVDLWNWYEFGGAGHVAAYLHQLDLSAFNPKAPPPKTPAFWNLVAVGEAPEQNALRDVLDAMGNPAVLTIEDLTAKCSRMSLHDLANQLSDVKSRRTVPHTLARMGYVLVRNDGAKDGCFKGKTKRITVYGDKRLPYRDQVIAARALCSTK